MQKESQKSRPAIFLPSLISGIPPCAPLCPLSFLAYYLVAGTIRVQGVPAHRAPAGTAPLVRLRGQFRPEVMPFGGEKVRHTTQHKYRLHFACRRPGLGRTQRNQLALSFSVLSATAV